MRATRGLATKDIMNTFGRRFSVMAVGLMAAFGCGESADSDDRMPEPAVSALQVPSGFPQPIIPDDNVPTEARIELGRRIFYDRRLSANGEQACGTCHQQALGFSDGRPTAIGSTGQVHPRNSSSLTNAVYNATLTWANPVLTKLENQILIPIFGEEPIELGVTGDEDEVLARFANDADYAARFAAAFDEPDPVTWGNVVKALASFSRALISGDSPFDRYTYEGQTSALSAAAIRGLNLFFSERLECLHCHGGFNFTEASVHANSVFEAALFHNTGLYNIDGDGAYPAPNTGLFEITNRAQDMGKFRAPTLRNIAVTAPYFHDGSAATLEDVIRTYEAGGRNTEMGPNQGDGRANPLKSGFIIGFSLTDQERSDLIAFLRSLTDESFLNDPRLSDPFAGGQ